ncbi:hypothetical protein LNP24_07930 [Klebsiella pneumoniae subsp. pneumoniae]|nr:hypothetical protein [Klebsiella pneumoniae subsp. pneumoniae]
MTICRFSAARWDYSVTTWAVALSVSPSHAQADIALADMAVGIYDWGADRRPPAPTDIAAQL